MKTWPRGQLKVLLSCDQSPGCEETSNHFLCSFAPLDFAAQPDFQANAWEALSPTGSIPSARHAYMTVWSDVADGFYVFGGHDGSRCLSGATLGNCN